MPSDEGDETIEETNIYEDKSSQIQGGKTNFDSIWVILIILLTIYLILTSFTWVKLN